MSRHGLHEVLPAARHGLDPESCGGQGKGDERVGISEVRGLLLVVRVRWLMCECCYCQRVDVL